MSSPDMHTNTLLAEGVAIDLALRFHLESRVFPYWSDEHVTVALPALRRAIAKARRGDWDARVRWTYSGDSTTALVSVRALFEGLNLWGFEVTDEEYNLHDDEQVLGSYRNQYPGYHGGI